MAATLLLFCIMNSTLNCLKVPSADTSRIIRNDSLYKYYGVIFDSSYKLEIELKNARERITPILDDVILTEKIFIDNYNIVNQTTKGREGSLFVENPKKYFWKYNRQYVGYIDKDNHKNIIILLFDYSNKRAVYKRIGNTWTNTLVLILADKMPFNVVLYRADLTDGKLYATF